MEVKILHLYSSLMNLYGEYGNIKALCRHLQDQGVQIILTETDTASEIDFQDFDFIYAGSGTEKNQKKALCDLMKSKPAFLSAVKEGVPVLFTGNAFEMLGGSITGADAKEYPALSLSGFCTKEQNKKRLTGDCICSCPFLSQPLVGFVNKCSEISGVKSPLFKMQMGLPNAPDDKFEGFHDKNVFGTHLIGPVLVKNPHFMDYMVDLICKTKDKNFVFTKAEYVYESAAYEVTLRQLKARMEKA